MSINLSDLTSPNNQDVLAEITSAADFLDPIGKLENLSRSPNKGGHALQTVALNQPRALPLDADGKGYCYLPVTTGNAPAVTFPTIGASDDFVLEMDVYLVDVSSLHLVSGSSQQERIIIYNSGSSFQCNVGNAIYIGSLTLLTEGVSTITVERTSGTVTLKQNGVTKGTINNVTGSATFSHLSWNGQYSTGVAPLNGYIQTCTLSINGTEQLNIDFTATNVRHGATKIKCATGQVVTINKSGNDPATIIKKPVLRFAGANTGLLGLLNQTVTDGYMFAAFSVLGDGGEGNGRILGLNSTGGVDSGAGGVGFRRNGTTNGLMIRYNENNITTHNDFFDDERGDYLLDVKVSTGSQKSKVNNADLVTGSVTGQLSSEEFSIGSYTLDVYNNAAIDLEFLALFSADSVPDEATASKIRDYINKRNNVFSLVDNSYYFFDPQKADFTGNFTDANTLDGYITGSDLGDTDVRSNLTLVQATLNDQPSTDGYTITFNDNAEHLEFENSASQNLSGWQVVGTSLGTFAYRVQGAVTELNLLGNLGSTSHRKAGQSYGMMLLPDSATGGDIEAARKLLIDRGAADGVSGTTLERYFSGRQDIVNFNHIETSNVTEMWAAFLGCNNIVSYPLIDTSSVTSMGFAFQSNNSLESFPAIQAPLCASFQNTWQGTTALQSFPAGAKLGTEAENVNFNSAWRSSGLTSFSTPLPTANDLFKAWNGCTSLESFSAPLTSATLINYAWNGCTSLNRFNSQLSSVVLANNAWQGCTSLTDFSADVFSNWNPSSIYSQVFNLAWDGCPLTAQSVENILTSIDASNQHGTDDGTSTGNPLGDSGIDIDYNVATGSLSAATNAAVTSLKAKGWVIVVNGVTL